MVFVAVSWPVGRVPVSRPAQMEKDPGLGVWRQREEEGKKVTSGHKSVGNPSACASSMIHKTILYPNSLVMA